MNATPSGQSSQNGIVFQPAEVEDVIVETIDEDVKAEADADMPYSKPQFPALTPTFGWQFARVYTLLQTQCLWMPEAFWPLSSGRSKG